ncbi:MAG: helicase, partial [Lentilitoribacter sp.]
SSDAEGNDAGPVVEVVTSKQIAKTDEASEAPSEDAKSDAAVEEKTDASEDAEEAPKPVLLWRPMGRNDRSRARPSQGKGGANNSGNRNRGNKGGKGSYKDGGKPRHNNKGKNAGGNNRPPRKDKPLDPDSPFAKLAALKDQLNK